MKSNSYYGFFRNFANKTKMAIITVLMDGPMNATDIAEILGEEQSKISHNLNKLAHCHVLEVRQEGKNRIYSLNKETVMPMLKIVEKHIESHCKGARCIE
ncbi:MAG: hypothetical protein DRN14_06970 [Thermoplasmata archaeon]|nr:MAG: hypothetical protein DRN14_06970 [Thermoplasmata archaeon]